MKNRSITCGWPVASRASAYRQTTAELNGCGAHFHGSPFSRSLARFSRRVSCTGLPLMSSATAKACRSVMISSCRVV